MLEKYNHNLLELFVRHTPAAIAMLDREMRYIMVSDRWIEDYQIKETDVIGRTHYEIFPEIPERWKQDHHDCLTGKVKFLKNNKDSFIRPNGNVDWLRWELRPWHDSEGQICGLLMFSEVITERILLEQKVKSSEIQMKAVFEAMTDLIFTIDLASNSIQILPTKFTDSDNALVRHKVNEQLKIIMFDSEEAENYRDLMCLTLQNKETFSFERNINIDDSEFWFSFNVAPISENKVVWVGHDITLRKEMEQNLLMEKELADITLKSIGDAVICTNACGLIKYINPVAEQLTGWSALESEGEPLTKVFKIVNQHTREPVANPVDLALKEHSIHLLPVDTILIAKDGTEHAIKDSAAPIINRQGQLIGAILVFHDVTQSLRLTKKLSWQASHDTLTGLYNRREFEKQVDIAIKSYQNNNLHHALCYLDLDRFKIINDTCGHAAGDELLIKITQLLQQRIRDSDTFARLGGDEFGILLHQCSIEIAQKIAEQLRQLIQNFRFTYQDRVFRVGASIGLVAIDSTISSSTDLLKKADAACYSAKDSRNCVHLYHHSQDDILDRQRGQSQWVEQINQALEENRFCLYAQKIVSLKEDNQLCHYEILLRLIDDSGKIILPGAFLPAAERYDLMPAIDRWVVSTFLAGYEFYCRLRQEQNLPLPSNLYTINLSGASINNQKFGTFLCEQFERYAIDPKTICFEITETVAISNLNNAINLIEQLKRIGCSIALDDFGSGMSSLNYLKHLPIDYLKIDGSFVKNIDNDHLDYATVECFKHISNIMNLETIAEFVENDAILKSLKQIGINYGQGYGIDRPQPLTFI